MLLAAGNLLGLVVAAIALVSLAGSRSHPLQRTLIALRFRDYLGRATTVTIDVDGVRFENDLASSLVPWSSVDRVRWNSRTVAIFHGRSLARLRPLLGVRLAGGPGRARRLRDIPHPSPGLTHPACPPFSERSSEPELVDLEDPVRVVDHEGLAPQLERGARVRDPEGDEVADGRPTPRPPAR